MSYEINVIICGIAGQGIVMAEKVLSEAAFAEGHTVFTADVPPISQRFAPMLSYVRMGDELYSVNFPEGEADLVLGFEPFQCLKFGLTFAAEHGVVVMNNRAIPMSENTKDTNLTTEDIEIFFGRVEVKKVYQFNASETAIQTTGNMITMSMVMLGAAFATEILPVRKESFEAAIEKFSPQKTIELNLKAFKAGIQKFEDI